MLEKFFNISALKSEIANGALTQKEVFCYQIAGTIMISLGAAPIAPNSSLLFWIYWLASGLINLFGVRKCYLANGANSGTRFLDKLVALGWVVSVRWSFMVLLPSLIAAFILMGIAGAALGIDEAKLQAYSELIAFIIMLVFTACLWLRIASHVRELR